MLDPSYLGLTTILGQKVHAKPKRHGSDSHVTSKLLESSILLNPCYVDLAKIAHGQALIFIWILLLLSWLCINPSTS